MFMSLGVIALKEPPCYKLSHLAYSHPVIDIADLVYLVDYMFNGGPAPVCRS